MKTNSYEDKNPLGKITSYWQHETANFDPGKREFVNRKSSPIKEKELEITVRKDSKDRLILSFHGGPTGFEAYYLQDILDTVMNSEQEDYCICAGTVNSWPRCWVKMKDLKKILTE